MRRALAVKISFEMGTEWQRRKGPGDSSKAEADGRAVPYRRSRRQDDRDAARLLRPKRHMVPRTWAMMPGHCPRACSPAPTATVLDYWPCFLARRADSPVQPATRDGGKSWDLMRVAVPGGEVVPFFAQSLPVFR